jgi:hypothetical protein
VREHQGTDELAGPHQAIVEFVVAVTRPLDRGRALLEPDDARREARSS